MKRRAAAEQVPMSYSKRGGARIGAGRPKQRDRGPSHAKRPELSGREPLHVTLRVLEHVYNPRARRCFELVCAATMAACNQLGFRIVALSLQGNHLHLLVEAATAAWLTRGVQGLAIRLAKGLNRLMGRHGQVFERFHARRLRTPREIRAAMAYIRGNTARHAAQAGRALPAGYRDPYTVGYFGSRVLRPAGTEGMVAEPETWLLRYGWQRGAAPATPARGAGDDASGIARSFGVLARCAVARGPDTDALSEHRDRPPTPPLPLAA